MTEVDLGLRINTNTQALQAQRQISINQEKKALSQDQLSSGYRITRSGDDAAGMSISEGLRSHVVSLRQARRNANDGISLVQVAEGGMNEISNILIRLRELSIQSASDSIGDPERGFIEKEVQHLKLEMDRITATTEFNGQKLLTGELDALEVQVGDRNRKDVDRLVVGPEQFSVNQSILGTDPVTAISKQDAQQSLQHLDEALSRLNNKRSNLGALQNRFQKVINFNMIHTENLDAARSRIRDADIAEVSSRNVQNQILAQASIATLMQANTSPQAALQLMI